MPLNYQSSMLFVVHDSFVTTYVSNPSCTFNISSCQTHHSSHVSLPSSYILNPIMPSYSNPINHRPNIQERKRTPNWIAFSPSSSLRRESLSLRREREILEQWPLHGLASARPSSPGREARSPKMT